MVLGSAGAAPICSVTGAQAFYVSTLEVTHSNHESQAIKVLETLSASWATWQGASGLPLS